MIEVAVLHVPFSIIMTKRKHVFSNQGSKLLLYIVAGCHTGGGGGGEISPLAPIPPPPLSIMTVCLAGY